MFRYIFVYCNFLNDGFIKKSVLFSKISKYLLLLIVQIIFHFVCFLTLGVNVFVLTWNLLIEKKNCKL